LSEYRSHNRFAPLGLKLAARGTERVARARFNPPVVGLPLKVYRTR
jgi:hypothetical protein